MRSYIKLTTKSIGKDKLLWAIFLVSAAVTIITKSELVSLFLASGILVWLVKAPPKKWCGASGTPGLFAVATQLPGATPVVATMDWSVLSQIAIFFAEAGAFVFGSGLAIVPFLYGGVVTEHHWLTERQFAAAVIGLLIYPGIKP